MPLIRTGEQALDLGTMLRERVPARAAPTTGQGHPAGSPACPGVAAADAGSSETSGDWRDCLPAVAVATTPLPAEQVWQVLTASALVHQAAWPSAAHGTNGLCVFIAALRVAGLSPGLYLFDTAVTDFVPIPGAPLPTAEEWRSTDPPALLLICADFGAVGRLGASGYAAMLVRAGALAESACRAATAAGLAAAGCARGSQDMTRAARQGGGRQRHLMTVALGPAATAGAG